LWWICHTYIIDIETVRPFPWLDFEQRGLPYPDVIVVVLLLIVTLLIAWFAPNTAEIFGLNTMTEQLSYKPTPWRLRRVFGVAILLCLCMFSIIGSVPSEFLYFQF